VGKVESAFVISERVEGGGGELVGGAARMDVMAMDL
jgi:hypothetical protein